MLNLLKEIFPITLVIVIVIGFVYLILLPFIAAWRLFKKVDIPGWKSLIPFYNEYLIFKIAGLNGFLSIPIYLDYIIGNFIYPYLEEPISKAFVLTLVLISTLSFIINIFRAIKLSKAFGKGTLFIIGMIFLPEIFQIILGMGKSQYLGDYKSE